MSLKAVVESLDAVPEALRGLYAEKDGKHVLQVEPAGGLSLECVSGLRKALDTERATRKEREALLKQFGDLTPDKLKEELKELERLRGIDLNKSAEKRAKEKVEAIRKSLHEEWSGKNAALEAQIDQIARVKAAEAAIAATGAPPELLMPHVLQRTKTVRTDDGIRVQVLNEAGEARHNAEGKDMTVADLIAEMRASDVFGRAFPAEDKRGSGVPPHKPAGGTGDSLVDSIRAKHPELR